MMANLSMGKGREEMSVGVIAILAYFLGHGWARLVWEVPEYFLKHGWATLAGDDRSIGLTETGKLEMAKVLGMLLQYSLEHGWAKLVDDGTSIELTNRGELELPKILGIGMA